MRRTGILAMFTMLIALTGCTAGGGFAGIEAPCAAGEQAPGETFTATDSSGTEIELTAGECFDTYSGDTLFGAPDDPESLGAACDSMGLEHQLNGFLGHGIRQLGIAITGLETGQVSGTCAFNPPIDSGLAGVTFTLINSDGSMDSEEYKELSWGYYVAAIGGDFEALDGHGERAGIIDNLDGGTYTVFAQGSGGEIVRILTYFPESQREQQNAIDERLVSWIDAGLKAAASL
jgi:hypothetical protein